MVAERATKAASGRDNASQPWVTLRVGCGGSNKPERLGVMAL